MSSSLSQVPSHRRQLRPPPHPRPGPRAGVASLERTTIHSLVSQCQTSRSSLSLPGPSRGHGVFMCPVGTGLPKWSQHPPGILPSCTGWATKDRRQAGFIEMGALQPVFWLTSSYSGDPVLPAQQTLHPQVLATICQGGILGGPTRRQSDPGPLPIAQPRGHLSSKWFSRTQC